MEFKLALYNIGWAKNNSHMIAQYRTVLLNGRLICGLKKIGTGPSPDRKGNEGSDNLNK